MFLPLSGPPAASWLHPARPCTFLPASPWSLSLGPRTLRTKPRCPAHPRGGRLRVSRGEARGPQEGEAQAEAQKSCPHCSVAEGLLLVSTQWPPVSRGSP